MKKVGIVLLAAGISQRYQGIKLLDIIDGQKMYLPILRIAASLNVIPKVIVTQYDEIIEKALEYGFEVILNKYPERGISHSIHLGLHRAIEMEPDLEGVMFCVCDQPYLEKDTLEKLLTVYSNTDKCLASVSSQGRLGNPCIIGRKYFEELFALRGDIGGKKIIQRCIEDVEMVMVENEKELIDIDRKLK